jgi:penicillin-binding protein 2
MIVSPRLQSRGDRPCLYYHSPLADLAEPSLGTLCVELPPVLRFNLFTRKFTPSDHQQDRRRRASPDSHPRSSASGYHQILSGIYLLFMLPKTSRSNNFNSLSRGDSRTVGKNGQGRVLLALVTLSLVGAIGCRLAYLQLIEGSKYRQRAEKNRVRIVAAKRPVRGNILDREGRIMVSNRLSHAVFVWPAATKKATWPESRKRLAEVLAMSEAEIQAKVEKVKASSPELVRLSRNLNSEQIIALKEFSTDKDGIELDIEAIRYYPYGEVASHVLGYTGELTEQELVKRRADGYRLTDLVGKSGAEAAFEETLRGEWGGRQVEVDGANRVQRDLGQKISSSGKDIRLTLDLDLQKAAEEALGKQMGAIVAMNPQNGEVLAMASRPGFDPNVFSDHIKPDVWKKLQAADHPLLNRALQAFPPASTFKIITTTAGLETGKFKINTKLQTYPSLRIGGTTFADWNHAGFGVLGFEGALKWSSDTFFYQIAQGVGGPDLIDWTKRYGFGVKTGIELPGERKGLVADDEWKRKHYKLDWSIGDTVNMSIGQGFLQVTPLQTAVMFAVVANGGYLVKPHLFTDPKAQPLERKSLNIKPENLQVIQRGLREVVNGGTGNALNVPTIPLAAGKSGTAEAPPGPVHVWFGSYAPIDKPEIVVVAFGEHAGGGGGKVAAPMVLKVMEKHFKAYQPPASASPKASGAGR